MEETILILNGSQTDGMHLAILTAGKFDQNLVRVVGVEQTIEEGMSSLQELEPSVLAIDLHLQDGEAAEMIRRIGTEYKGPKPRIALTLPFCVEREEIYFHEARKAAQEAEIVILGIIESPFKSDSIEIFLQELPCDDDPFFLFDLIRENRSKQPEFATAI